MGKDRLLFIQVLIADILLMSATVCLSYWGTIWVNPAIMGGFRNMFYLMTIYDICLLACNTIYPSIIQNRIVRIEDIIQRTIVISLLLLLFVSLLTVLLEAEEHFPRTYTLTTVGLFALLSVAERLLIRRIINSERSKDKDLTQVVLIGKEPSILNLLRVLNTPHYGYDIKGVFYDGECDIEELKNLRLGETKDIYSYLATNQDIKEIYGFYPHEQQDRIAMLSKYCDNHLIRFFYVPSLDAFKSSLTLHILDGIPVFSRREEPLANPLNKIIKRLFDFTVSAFFLITLFPWIFIVVSIMIKIQSPGPIFFKQARTGLDGKVFNCIKFRTMKVNDQADTLQATADDPRKYPFGDFMRRTNIDEFPQFINVLRGDMSLVGPRPHMLKHTEEYSHIINRYMVRHLAKPGITGLAQVSGFRGETKHIDQMEGRVRLDIEYIENWTFLMDLRIIIKTITNMLRKEENAY